MMMMIMMVVVVMVSIHWDLTNNHETNVMDISGYIMGI